ncbi:MAG TPA: cobalamin B12-binding domain-containing protein [Ilumatobacteraceae bacterium]|nr:cobalamin B12-binding domain-containing protein [Ilumatobacteraceae bacterium]
MARENPPASTGLRIGELSRRVGVSEYVLRAWETRYGLLHPPRSTGGFRLYSPADERRVRRMQFHLAQGLSAAEAAAEAIAEADDSALPLETRSQGVTDDVTESSARLQAALDEFDEAAAQLSWDRLLSDLTLETVLRDIVLPYLHDLGERWKRQEITIAQEHFASNMIRGRLAGLARGWGAGHGPRAILACPPGEVHDLPLMIFGIVLHRSGWRVDYLGANTPIEELVTTAHRIQSDLVVLAAVSEDRFAEIIPELVHVGQRTQLALAGVGATARIADQVGARLLAGDPVTAAQNERWRR